MPQSQNDRSQISEAPPDMEKIVTDHYARVFRFAAHRVGPDTASDIAQETFLTMQNSIKKFKGQSALSSWILGITLNLCRNHNRKKSNQEIPLENWIESTGENEKNLINRQVLKQALAKLTPEHQEVVLLHEVEELSYKEISELIGIPEGTVKSRLHHAFHNLRQELCGGSL